MKNKKRKSRILIRFADEAHLSNDDFIFEYVCKKIRNQPFYGQLHLAYHFNNAAEKFDFTNTSEKYLLQPYVDEIKNARRAIRNIKKRHLEEFGNL